MQEHGYRIIPVNPTYAGTYILNELCYATLKDAAKALSKENLKIDLVNCFRRSQAITPIADEAIAIGARCLWMQLGIINEEAADKATAAGMDVVMDHCIKIEHMRRQLQKLGCLNYFACPASQSSSFSAVSAGKCRPSFERRHNISFAFVAHS